MFMAIFVTETITFKIHSMSDKHEIKTLLFAMHYLIWRIEYNLLSA